MSDILYNAVRFLGAPFAYRCFGLENIRDNGPALFVANHLGALGPVEIVLSLPVRLYPWIAAEMTDPERSPQHLYGDLVHPSLHLHGRPGMAVATLISTLAVRFVNRLGCIPVDSSRGRYMAPFRRSLALLGEGRNLLVLPEDVKEPPDPETKICPFRCGFLLLCPLYEQLTGAPLPVYPVAVSSLGKAVSVGAPLFFAPRSRRRAALRGLSDRLEAEVHRLYKATSPQRR